MDHSDTLVAALEELKGSKPREIAAGPAASNGAVEQAEMFKEWHPKNIRQRHRLVYALHACGWTGNEIAEHVGYSASRVSIILNDPRAQAIIDEFGTGLGKMVSSVREKLELHSNEAVDEIASLIKGATKENVRLNAAKAILDRAGYGTVSKVIRASEGLTNEQVEILARGLADADAAYEAVEGVDYTIEG
jgi:transcriptional regulator